MINISIHGVTSITLSPPRTLTNSNGEIFATRTFTIGYTDHLGSEATLDLPMFSEDPKTLEVKI